MSGYEGKASALAEADGLLLRTFARRCGVYLALAAVTLQLALSFGHVHRHDLAYPIVAYSKIDVFYGPASAHKTGNIEAIKARGR